MDYATWEKAVPDAITRDPLWRMRVYRLSLFVADVGWPDVTRLARDRRTTALSDQLYRALGSIGANTAEGFTVGVRRRTKRASTSMRWDRREKAAIGTGKHDTYSAKRQLTNGYPICPRSFACC